MSLSFEQIRERLVVRFGDAVGATVPAKDPFVVVKAERLLEIARYLHDDPDLALDYLIDATAVDYPKERLLRLVYHLWSVGKKHGFKVKVECDRAEPKAPSVESIWRGANWLEREVFDLFGLRFEGHPDLRRIMMPEDWVGHPLLKDYQEIESYHGIGHGRASMLETYKERDKKNRPPPPPAPPKPAATVEAKPAEVTPVVEAKPVDVKPEEPKKS